MGVPELDIPAEFQRWPPKNEGKNGGNIYGRTVRNERNKTGEKIGERWGSGM